jgi:ammonia channel protein AmtB
MYLTSELRREVFLNEFTMFASLDTEFVNSLIAIYDKNLLQARLHSHSHLAIFGGILTLFAWSIFNSSTSAQFGKEFTFVTVIFFNTITTAFFSSITYYLV